MKKGLAAVGFSCLFLLLPSTHAYSSIHKIVVAHSRKRASGKRHPAPPRVEVSGEALPSPEPGQTPVAEKESLRLKVSKGRRRVAMPAKESRR